MIDSSRRLEFIDALRGVAILAVMVCHYIPHLGLSYKLDFSMISHYADYGKYGVHLFFIISGYVIYMTVGRAKSPLHFAYARFSRLYPAFWIAVTFSFALIVIFGHPFKEFNPDIFTYFANMTMLQRYFLYPSIDGVYWSLTFELMFYFYMGLLMVVGLQHQSHKYSIFWLLCTIAITILAQGNDIVFSERWKGVFILEFNSFFLTGVAIYNFHKTKDKMSLMVIIILSFLQQLLFAGTELAVVYVLTTSLFFVFANMDNLVIRFLSKIGKISYSLYLIHAIPGYTLINILSNAGFPMLLSLVITVFTSFVIAFVMWYFVEIPSQKKLRNWFDLFLTHRLLFTSQTKFQK